MAGRNFLAPPYYSQLIVFASLCECFLGQLTNVDLIILEGENVRPSVRPSVRPQKVSSISMKFGIQVEVHDGMPYGRIQGQGQGHEPLKL